MHFLEVHGRSSLPPLRASGMRVLNYLYNCLILAQSRDTPASHIDKLLRHLDSRGNIEAQRLWCKDIFSRGDSPGLGDVMCHGHDGRIVTRVRGAVFEGIPASWLLSEPQSRWHINRLVLEAVFLALKEFRLQL